MPASSVDALITDPPYASGGPTAAVRQQAPAVKYSSKKPSTLHHDFSGDHHDQRSHLRWLVLWLSECCRILKPGAAVCLFSDWRQLPLTTDALQMAGFTWRGIAVWDKTESVRPQLGRFRSQCEYIVWGSQGDMPLKRDVGVLPGVVRQVIKPADKFHLTGKPVAVMRHINQICRPGGLILDPFAGSGSTLVAAQMDNYPWIGCELSAHYHQIALERVQAL